MSLVRLENYLLKSSSLGEGRIRALDFSLEKGDVVAIEAEHPEDAHIFLRAIATLEIPDRGAYLYEDQTLDLGNYQSLLPVKRKIGYVAHDSAVLSNRSVRENLLFSRYYMENSMDLELDEDVAALCRLFNIYEKLEARPSGLGPMEKQAVVLIRELAKLPEIILLDRPDDFIGQANFSVLFEKFRELVRRGVAIMIFAFDMGVIEKYVNKKVMIKDGAVETVNSGI